MPSIKPLQAAATLPNIWFRSDLDCTQVNPAARATAFDVSDAYAQCASQGLGDSVHDYACSAGVEGSKRRVPCDTGAGRGCSGAGYRYVVIVHTQLAFVTAHLLLGTD